MADAWIKGRNKSRFGNHLGMGYKRFYKNSLIECDTLMYMTIYQILC